MARYTAAYSSFLERLEEVALLLGHAASLERKDAFANASGVKAYCRGAVVLLSGHLEGYIKDVGELALDRIYERAVPRAGLTPRFFYEISKERFEELRNISDPAQFARKMFAFLLDDGGFWDAAGPFPTPIPTDRFLKGFASPTVNKIATFFGRFGYDDFKRI